MSARGMVLLAALAMMTERVGPHARQQLASRQTINARKAHKKLRRKIADASRRRNRN